MQPTSHRGKIADFSAKLKFFANWDKKVFLFFLGLIKAPPPFQRIVITFVKRNTHELSGIPDKSGSFSTLYTYNLCVRAHTHIRQHTIYLSLTHVRQRTSMHKIPVAHTQKGLWIVGTSVTPMYLYLLYTSYFNTQSRTHITHKEYIVC